MPGPFFYEAHGDQILVWCTTVFLDLAAGGGNSTVTDISLLLRMSPSFTLAASPNTQGVVAGGGVITG